MTPYPQSLLVKPQPQVNLEAPTCWGRGRVGVDCPNCRLSPTPLSGGPFRSASDPQPFSPPLSCDLGLCPRKTRRSQRNGRVLSSPSPASAAPSPVSSAPPSGAWSSHRVLCCLDRRPFRAVCSQPPGHPGAHLALQRGPQCGVELPSRAPRPVFWVLTAGLLVSSASPSAAAVFLRYVGAAACLRVDSGFSGGLEILQDLAPSPRPLAQPAWRPCLPHRPPGRSCHRACAGLCPGGLRQAAARASSMLLSGLCAPQAQPCVPRLGSLLTRHLTLRALLAPVRTRACGSRAVAGQHWPAELLGSYLSEWLQRGLSKPKAGTPASLHLD